MPLMLRFTKKQTSRKRLDRLYAIISFFVMIIGIVIPPASAYAATVQNQALNPAPDTPMKQNYSGPLQAVTSTSPSAADAHGTGVLGTLTKSSSTAGDTLGKSPTEHITPHELTDKRTATSDVRQNADGTLTARHYLTDHYYKNNGQWQPIQANLIEDTNAADSTNVFGKMLGDAESLISKPNTYKMAANQWQARFAASDDRVGMVRLQYDGQTITMRPNGAAGVTPYITTDANGNQAIHYDNLWPGINVEYQTVNDMLREFVILNGNDSPSTYSFAIDGASMVPDPKVTGAFKLKGALENEFEVAPLTVSLMNRGVISEPVTQQTYADGSLTVQVNKDWLKTLPKENFPVVIDPSFSGTFSSGAYTAYKSDGYTCASNSCYMDAGTLNDMGYWKSWQTEFYAPYSQAQGGTLEKATMHLIQMPYTPGRYYGVYDGHTITLWHGSCGAFNCVDTSNYTDSCWITTVCDIDATNIYKTQIARGDWNAWLMMTGEQNPANSLKMIDPNNSYMSFNYMPQGPTIASPVANQVYTDQQASFTLNSMGSGYQYSFTVSNGIGYTTVDGVNVTVPQGTVVSSGSLSATQWTVPDGILQDGSTYYVQAQAYDPSIGVWSNYGPAVQFKVDLRTGKDSTQTNDTVGPVSVDLATGNVTTTATSHASSALGGSLGVNLTYNSPLKSRPGLVGDYYNNTNFSGNPILSRLDQSVNFNWGTGAPASTVNASSFGVRWQGYFIAPTTGTYYFGGIYDDTFRIYINDQVVMDNSAWTSTPTYGTAVTLQAGSITKIKIEMTQLGGASSAELMVKGAVNEQVVPATWLQSGVRQLSQSSGLSGTYYNDDGSHSFTDTANTMFLQRTDPTVSFNWGAGSPVPGGPTDNFMARWTGYLTAPTSGTYTFGANSDDGSRITINNNQVLSNWQDGALGDQWGNAVTLTANQPVPVTIDYYEHGGSASMVFEMLVNGVAQTVPASWLSPQAQVVPSGWQLGIDADGSVSYEHLTANQNDVLLTDSQGNTHDYTWTGSGYKAPVNEDGSLVRNNDGTFTLQDSDGRTYVFGANGVLNSVTSAADDRNPAALKYTYGATLASGGPTTIKQITDGVDSSRWAQVYYSGDANCNMPPTGFDASAPANMICAVITNDGRATYFYYLGGQLARISQPGNANTDFQYETVQNAAGQSIGARLIGVRDALANDAIAAGTRANDSTTETQITYDTIGRAANVTSPAANASDVRQQTTFEYLPGTIGYQNGNPTTGYFGATQEHIVGAPEPNGFSRRVEYDNLFRVTKSTDKSGLSTTSLWDANKDLLYSTTDPTGNLSSTIYDDEDRAMTQYGPAPASWFTTTANATTGHTDITPQSSYASQVPRSDTSYDQGITGTAVTWYGANSTTGSFSGAPVAHTTGISPTVDPTWLGRDFRSTGNPIPASYGLGTDFGFSATGKVRFPGSGTYTLQVWHDDGVRVWVDNRMVIDDWAQRTQGVAQDSPSGTFTAVAGKVYSFRFDYIHFGDPGALELWFTGPNIPISNQANQLGTSHVGFMSPDYSLPTSTTAYDSVLGNTTTTTNYGATPELGLPQSTSVDPSGQNLVTSSAYEAPGTGFLRQTSKSLAGGNTTIYSYYGATETRANPCVSGSPAVSQAGKMKLRTTQDPDGSGPQTGVTTETIYNASGNAVATRMNNDSWTCTTYDARGRITQYVVPSATNRAGRTVTTNYAVGGNPLSSSVTDSASGTTTTQIDLLGRGVQSTDMYGDQTSITYDALGRPTTQQSLKGTETVTYDDLGRITSYALNGTTYASIVYDQYNRVASVTYPQAQSNGQPLKLSQVKYDATQANDGATYTFSDGSTYDETVGRTAQTGAVTSDTIAQGGKTVTSNYQYDSVGRLTSATIDNWLYQYGFGSQAASCASLPGYNANANMDGNRTSYTVTNTATGSSTTTNNCYNIADQLMGSTDAQVGTPVYDAYGNITQFAGGGTPITLVYNASNQNTSITQGANQVVYAKDPGGNVLARSEYNGTTLKAAYRTVGGVLQTCNTSNTAQCSVTDVYVSLPGGVDVTIPASAIPQSQSVNTNVPSPWITTKVGPSTQNGSATYANNAFTVSSSGQDQWRSLDQEQLLTQTLEGDGQITARVVGLTNTNEWAKAGVIIKSQPSANAYYNAVMVTPGNGVRGESNYNTDTYGGTYSTPEWLKLVRAGNTTTTYRSDDGANWTQVSSDTNTGLPSTMQIGLFVLSGDSTLTATATFDNVTVTPATTSTLPAGWTNGDTGSPAGPAGTSSYTNGTFKLTGNDDDVWGTEDQAQRAYQTLTGNGQIVARVASQSNSNAWAKAGVFIKASPADMSDYASLHTTPGNGMQMEWNYNNSVAGGSYTIPNTWLRLVRNGNTIIGFRSTDGVNWSEVSSTTTPNLPSTVMIGLLMVSGDDSVTGTATFDNVAVTPLSTPTTLPAGWASGDTGNPASPPGTSTYVNGVFTLTGNDDDVWGTEDQAQRAYKTLTGDGQIVARVVSQSNSNSWAKAGVFIKSSMTSMSDYAALEITPGNGVGMEWNYNNSIAGGSYTKPEWLKLVRAGSTITTYKSADGATWTQVGSTNTPNLPTTAIVGMLVVSGNPDNTGTATFDNVTVTPTNPQTPATPTAVYSIQNFHGDTAITTGSDGLPNSGVHLYDPFGGVVNSATFGTSREPGNASDRGMGWATSPDRKQESMFTLAVMQMGARVYLPSLGRFAQMDPVEGGTPNPYTYVLDPINFADYNGQWGIPNWIKSIIKVIVIAVVVVAVVAAAILLLPDEIIGAAVTAVATVATRAASIISAASAGISRAASAAASAVTGAGRIIGNIVNGASTATLRAAPEVNAATNDEQEVDPAYKSSLQTGQAAHNEFNGIVRSAGGTPNSRLGDTLLRPDGQFENGDVWELKPGNPRGVAAGLKQLQGYMNISGGNGQLWLYNQNDDGGFNFWMHQ